MKTYTVWMSNYFSRCAEYTIEANSEEEAIKIAMEDADIYDFTAWDFDIAESYETQS